MSVQSGIHTTSIIGSSMLGLMVWVAKEMFLSGILASIVTSLYWSLEPWILEVTLYLIWALKSLSFWCSISVISIQVLGVANASSSISKELKYSAISVTSLNKICSRLDLSILSLATL
ncbi:MAG: hypothetical protein PHQ54_03325 [Candidatus Omnitrophica bacterium]|nr:hypothetical protein [Candidatus Omnitrophota bacterium]